MHICMDELMIIGGLIPSAVFIFRGLKMIGMSLVEKFL